MAGGIDWFRWHHGSVTDPKFQLVARKSGARLSDVLAVWAFLLEQASASDNRGSFGDIDAESIDCLFGFDDGLTASIVEQMGERGLVDGDAVSAWEKRQPKREDDTAAERKRRQRERDHELQVASGVTVQESRNVTQRHAHVTHGHDRGEESREDISPSLRSGESAETAPTLVSEKAGKAKTLTAYLESCKAAKAKPIPDGHSVRTWAADAGITPEMLQIAWVQFRERYTEAEKGKGKRYKDWPGHFATAVKSNWFKLWFSGDKGMQWSSNGMMHKTVLDSRMKAQEAANA